MGIVQPDFTMVKKILVENIQNHRQWMMAFLHCPFPTTLKSRRKITFAFNRHIKGRKGEKSTL